jgi:hypothetical protein
VTADVDPGTYQGDYPWKSNIIHIPFHKNGDIFYTIVNGDVPDSAQKIDGYTSHKYDPHVLFCFPYHKPKVVQLPDGTWCQSAFVCNHRVETGPWPKLNVDLKVGRESVDLKRHYDVNEEVYGLIPLEHDVNVCGPDPIPIPRSDCSITFSCSGSEEDDSLKTLPALRDALEAISKDTQHVKTWTETSTVCKPCRPIEGEFCVPYCQEFTTERTRVPKRVEMEVRDEDEHVLGHLNYKIKCDEPPFCRVCDELAVSGFTGLTWAMITVKAFCIGACGI